jgi:chromosome segregation ATPase
MEQRKRPFDEAHDDSGDAMSSPENAEKKQHSFETRVKEAINEAKLKRLEDKLDRANTQIETEKQQVIELEKRLKAATRREGMLDESLQQLEWKYEGAINRLSQV